MQATYIEALLDVDVALFDHIGCADLKGHFCETTRSIITPHLNRRLASLYIHYLVLCASVAIILGSLRSLSLTLTCLSQTKKACSLSRPFSRARHCGSSLRNRRHANCSLSLDHFMSFTVPPSTHQTLHQKLPPPPLTIVCPRPVRPQIY